jgi:hypothetical protein
MKLDHCISGPKVLKMWSLIQSYGLRVTVDFVGEKKKKQLPERKQNGQPFCDMLYYHRGRVT